MEVTLSAAELDDRIAILRDNIRQLVQQAAAASGEQNESRTADRINPADRGTRQADRAA